MYTLTGQYATLFRAPYGEIDENVVRLAAEMGLTTVQFDLASGDPDRRASKKRLIEHVTRRARNGSIVVMHMNGRGHYTADALPEIVKRLRAKGYQFVTVGQLMAPQPAPAPIVEHVRVDPEEDSAAP
jgi:peptidoglycan/xylan/chitin deacetylase (PgdA/CDA1 family)